MNIFRKKIYSHIMLIPLCVLIFVKKNIHVQQICSLSTDLIFTITVTKFFTFNSVINDFYDLIFKKCSLFNSKQPVNNPRNV